MAKEKKARPPVHHCKRFKVETQSWRTACGLKLDRDARREHVLADEWEHVTCKACKKEKPEPED